MFAIVSNVSKIPIESPTENPVGTTIHGRNMEITAPEAYIERAPFGETDFKLDLSIFNPSTGTILSRLDATGKLSFVIDDRPKK